VHIKNCTESAFRAVLRRIKEAKRKINKEEKRKTNLILENIDPSIESPDEVAKRFTQGSVTILRNS
jgi:hypothetical protein